METTKEMLIEKLTDAKDVGFWGFLQNEMRLPQTPNHQDSGDSDVKSQHANGACAQQTVHLQTPKADHVLWKNRILNKQTIQKPNSIKERNGEINDSKNCQLNGTMRHFLGRFVDFEESDDDEDVQTEGGRRDDADWGRPAPTHSLPHFVRIGFIDGLVFC
jgi:hypothetical protein